MMNKPIQKLLAVMTFVGAASTSAIAAPRTLANGAPAPGNTVAKGGTTYSMKSERRAEASLNQARRALAAAYTEEREAVAAITAEPRVLANGAPACGNTGGKPMVCTAEVADQWFAMRIQRVLQASELIDRARAQVTAAEKVYAQYATDHDDVVAMEVQP